MTDPTQAFAKMVPGFDFLQGLVKNAGSAIPGIGAWVSPTLDPEEIDKRIQELRTVQYWLEQNARMTASTIQALEVQRMTLSTLKTMNVSLGDLAEALKIRTPEPAPAPPAGRTGPSSWAGGLGIPADEEDEEDDAPEADDAEEDQEAPPPARAASPRRPAGAGKAAAPAAPAGVVDPMQWWGALTQQFTQIATNAMKDSAAEAARQMAGAMVKQGMDAAGDTLMKAAAMPAHMAQNMANNVASVAGKAAGTAAGLVKAASQPRAAGGRSAAAKRTPASGSATKSGASKTSATTGGARKRAARKTGR